jgi:hypothetical protein
MLYQLGFAPSAATNIKAKLQYPTLRVLIKNYGNTPAFLKTQSVEFTCDSLPDEPIYNERRVFQPESVIEAGSVYSLSNGEVRPRYSTLGGNTHAVCFWQVGLAHFGRLIWPTLGR